MNRAAAINHARAGAQKREGARSRADIRKGTPGSLAARGALRFARVPQKIWAGTVTICPNAKTGAHHHGPLESVI